MKDTPVIDIAEALERAMGDAEFLKMMMDELRRSIPGFLTRLDRARRQDDMLSLGKDAHQLKGAAANLGAKSIAEAALKLEQIGKSGESFGCDKALEELRQAVEIFVRHLGRIDWNGLSAQSAP